MTSRRKRRQQDGFMKKVSSLFNLDTVSKSSEVLKEIFFLKIRFFPTAHQVDNHGSVHRRLLSRNTNKMQLCNRIYYSKVF